MDNNIINWSSEDMIEIKIKEDDDFLKIKETLTRIGVASKKDKTLYQSCHILHKQGRYYIVHFKELFGIDGKSVNLTQSDLERRNAIVNLLEEWGLLAIIDPQKALPKCEVNHFKILAYRDKENWTLTPKYNIGNS